MSKFILLLIVGLSFYRQQKKKAFFWAFVLGLLIDLWTGTWLGTTSLALLIIAFLAYLYTKKYSSSHFLFQVVFVFIAVWVFDFIKGGVWRWFEGVFWALFSVFGLYFLKKFFAKQEMRLEV